MEARTAFQALIQKLDGKDIELSLRRRQKRRSLNQNSYYWGVVIPLIGEFCGYDKDDMHFNLKQMFLRDREHEEHGLIRVRSTVGLSTTEFNDYVEQCVRWAVTELGVIIPDPGQAAV